MKRGFRYACGLLGVLALISLAGCGSTSHHSDTQSAASTSQVKNNASLWNSSKDVKLKQFMNQWAPTMNQSYDKYDGHHELSTNSGMKYPKDLSETTVNGSKNSIGWSGTGKGKYDYNVVALYNDNQSGNSHITYAFAFHNGEPVALVDQSTNGTPNWTPTKNTDVSGNFEQIAGGKSADFSSSTSSSSSSTKSDNSSESSEDQKGSSKVHLNGGQSSVDYITKKMGDQGWTVTGGTYGGAHGAPTDGNYVPYNSVQNDNGDVYYVYQDGRIEKQN